MLDLTNRHLNPKRKKNKQIGQTLFTFSFTPYMMVSFPSPHICCCLPASLFTPCAKEWKSHCIMCCASHHVKAGEEIKGRETRADWPDKVNLDTV